MIQKCNSCLRTSYHLNNFKRYDSDLCWSITEVRLHLADSNQLGPQYIAKRLIKCIKPTNTSIQLFENVFH